MLRSKKANPSHRECDTCLPLWWRPRSVGSGRDVGSRERQLTGEVSVRASTSRAQIDARFASNQDLGQVLAQVARLSVGLVMQPALQAEVTELVGRDPDPRGQQARLGYRNGHGELHVSTIAARWCWRGPGCTGPPSRLPRGCWARASAHRCAGVAGAVGVRGWLARPGRGGRG